MWAVLKIDKKNLFFLKKDLEKKLGEEVQFYNPKILIEKFYQNKKISKSIDLLGDYIFCFNKNFSSSKKINTLNYCKGLKYFLNGFESSQDEIAKFLKICKRSENESGFITKNIFDLEPNKNYKFLNGPFVNQIFKLIEIQKNKIYFNLGQFKSYIGNKNILIRPI